MTSYVTPKKNAEFICYISLVSQSTGQFQVNPTIAAGDFKVSTDGGAFANLATLPAVTPAGGRAVKITLSASEMNGDNIFVQGVDAAGAEWDEVAISIQTTARQIDDLAYPTTSGRSIDVTTTGEVGIDWANVGSPTTTVNLSGTTVKTATDVEADTSNIQSRLPAALTADGNIKADTLRVGGTLQTAGDIIGDTNDIQSRLPAALSGDGFIKADLKSIEDELTSGNNATLNLKKLNVINSAGDAVLFKSTGSNGNGMTVEAHGDGNGIFASGTIGGAGHGIYASADLGSGFKIQSISNDALSANGGSLYAGIFASAGLYGLEVFGGTAGLYAVGTGDNSSGIYAASEGIDGDGVLAIGVGTGKSINAANDISVSDGNLTLSAIASAVWANATRTLTAIADSAGVTTLLSRIASALNISSGKVESNVKQINDTNITGDGSTTPWGPA